MPSPAADAGNSGPDFSICVPTFNRAPLLHRLFANLAEQADARFELVIVNDGSSDATPETIAALARDAPFPVTAIDIANQGRGAALNRAFDAARGRFIFLMDDDDLIVPGALGDILSVWQSIPAVERGRFCGVCGLSVDPAGKTIGQRFPADTFDGDFFTLRILRGVRGDKREVVLRAAIGDFRFPLIPGEKRIATNLLWFHLARRYRTRFVNRPWLIKDRHPGGITANGLKQKVASPRLTATYYRTTLALFPEMPLAVRFRFMVNNLRFATHGGESFATSLAGTSNPVTAALAAPIARLLVWKDRYLLARQGARR